MQSLTIEKADIQGKSTESNCFDTVKVEYPQISKSLLLLFCGYVIIWYLQIGVRITALGAIRFEFIYAAVLTTLALFVAPKIDTKCPLIPYIVLYFLVIVIQVPFSYDFNTSWDVFVDRIVKFAFMAFFIVSFVRSPTHLKFFLGAFLLACLKMGQEGLIGKITGGMIWENQGIMRLHGATPMYDHPNSFSGMALGTLPFVFYLWPLNNKYIKLLLSIIAILSLNIVLYTGSRTGYVGFLFFALFFALTSKNKKKFLILYFLIFIVTIPAIPADYIGRFDSIFSGKDKEGKSTEARKQILKDAWQIFEDHPLGVGVGAFPKIRMDTFGRSQDTHNLYLEIATNLGVQGLIIVGILIYKMITTLNNIRVSSSKMIGLLKDSGQYDNELIPDLKLIEAVALATIAFLFIRLTLGFFGMDMYEIYWWFAIGITMSLY
jgi:putative inorganic carbon (hco3(-)) transporter